MCEKVEGEVLCVHVNDVIALTLIVSTARLRSSSLDIRSPSRFRLNASKSLIICRKDAALDVVILAWMMMICMMMMLIRSGDQVKEPSFNAQ